MYRVHFSVTCKILILKLGHSQISTSLWKKKFETQKAMHSQTSHYKCIKLYVKAKPLSYIKFERIILINDQIWYFIDTFLSIHLLLWILCINVNRKQSICLKWLIFYLIHSACLYLKTSRDSTKPSLNNHVQVSSNGNLETLKLIMYKTNDLGYSRWNIKTFHSRITKSFLC